MKPSLAFTKMHGLGNDFVVVNALQHPFDDQTFSIAHLANRHLGIGFDQLLVIESGKNADFFCRIYNADGSEAEQCGNGLRCVARFIHENGLHAQNTLNIETKAGVFQLKINDYDHIQITMGIPSIQHPLVDLNIAQNKVIAVSILSMGNPHAITQVQSVNGLAIEPLAKTISSHAYFPQGVNVGFMQVISPHHIRLRTVERGVGETYACGSNACAATIAGILNGWLQKQVKVEFTYGTLTVDWEGEDKPVYMTGPAVNVYSGMMK